MEFQIPLILFAATFMTMALSGAQNLFVTNGKYISAFINCIMVMGANMILFKFAPSANATEIIAFLLGGPFGLMTAMYILRHLHISQALKDKNNAAKD